MTKEIFIVSNQLLYLAGSSLHIHTKLMRCLPFTRTMRGDFQMLLGEWYHDAEGALRRFKLRLGTEEGLSFVETIDSLDCTRASIIMSCCVSGLTIIKRSWSF